MQRHASLCLLLPQTLHPITRKLTRKSLRAAFDAINARDPSSGVIEKAVRNLANCRGSELRYAFGNWFYNAIVGRLKNQIIGLKKRP
jgi:hypothetical protein